MSQYYLYIVLTKPGTILSNIISLLKKDNYTHASIALDRNLNKMYSFGRKNIYNPFYGVFRKEDVDHFVYNFKRELPGLVLEVEVTEEQYIKACELVREFVYNSNFYKYNYKGLLYSAFGRETRNKRRFLCSEFVCYVLQESYITNFNMPRNLVRPQNLLNVRGNIIYEGNLAKFKALRC